MDFQVENALLEQALNGNVTAQIFWLKNRRRAVWKDKPEDAEAQAVKNHVTITFGSQEMEEYGD